MKLYAAIISCMSHERVLGVYDTREKAHQMCWRDKEFYNGQIWEYEIREINLNEDWWAN